MQYNNQCCYCMYPIPSYSILFIYYQYFRLSSQSWWWQAPTVMSPWGRHRKKVALRQTLIFSLILHFRNSPKSIQVIQTFCIFWHLGLDSLALGLASFSLPFSLEFFLVFFFGDFSSGSFLFTGAVGIGVAFLGWLWLASLASCHTALRFWLFLTSHHVFCIAVWTVALQIARKAKFQPSIDFLKM